MNIHNSYMLAEIKSECKRNFNNFSYRNLVFLFLAFKGIIQYICSKYKEAAYEKFFHERNFYEYTYGAYSN